MLFRRTAWPALFMFLLWVGSSLGCAMPSVRQTTKQATQGAAEQGLGVMENPRTRQRLAELMGSAEMQKTMREVAAGFSDGLTGSLTNEASEQRITALMTAVAETSARASIDASMREMNSPENQRRMQESAEATADAAMRGIMHELSVGMAGEMGPALRRSMTDDVGSGVRDMLDRPEVRQVLAGVAFEVARQAVLGTRQGVADIEHQRDAMGLFARISGVVVNGGWVLLVLLAASLVFIVILLVRGRKVEAAPLVVALPDRARHEPRRRLLRRRHRLARHVSP